MKPVCRQQQYICCRKGKGGETFPPGTAVGLTSSSKARVVTVQHPFRSSVCRCVLIVPQWAASTVTLNSGRTLVGHLWTVRRSSHNTMELMGGYLINHRVSTSVILLGVSLLSPSHPNKHILVNVWVSVLEETRHSYGGFTPVQSSEVVMHIPVNPGSLGVGPSECLDSQPPAGFPVQTWRSRTRV